MECCTGWGDLPEPVRDTARQKAQDIIWAASGRRFGLCPVTVRPCRRRCAPAPPALWQGVGWYPAVSGGRMVNVSTCGCASTDSCSCGQECSVRLSPGPVADIIEVVVDGQTVPDDAYQVLDSADLVRVDGGCWPQCQRFDVPGGAVGTWAVTYDYGIPVPAGGLAAAATLACELARSCTGAGRCRLPQRVQSITRDGVSMSFLDPMEFLDKGRTGLPDVDQWLVAVNPHGLAEASRVLSPDLPGRPRQVTWP